MCCQEKTKFGYVLGREGLGDRHPITSRLDSDQLGQ